jgi:Acetyltransferases, including N-acetylases of ribosomal proteins
MQNLYETGRLALRVLDEADAPAVLDYYARNRSFLEEWEPVREEAFYTLAHQREMLKSQREQRENDDSLRLWIFKKENPGRTIGFVVFNNIVKGAFYSCFLGYGLDEPEINRGYMTEAIQKGIDVMFGEYGLHRIEANIMPKNVRSLRVAEKLGFANEGLSRKYLKINGVWEDHIHMVLLNDRL